MKPLELTVYPEGGCETAAHCELKRYCVECVDEIDKRFTDAELAAEYHKMDSDCQVAWIDGEHTEAMQDRFETLERFATLPHYDEASL